MRIVELTIARFDEFASNHPLRNYCQSSAYAKFMGEQGFSYDYIGYEDDSHNIVAASLILYKRIGGFLKYGYAPKGFLIDYYNADLLNSFITDLGKKYKSRGIVFLKINPEIIIGELKAKKNFAGEYNQNVKIIDDLKSFKFKRRRELNPFELVCPRINPYINLKKYDVSKLDDDIKKIIAQSDNKGLEYEIATSKEIGIFYNFIKNTTTCSINSYRNLLNIFSKDNMAELILVKVDYKKFLVQAQENYNTELENNNACNDLIRENASEENINLKMESDKLLLQLKNNIIEATEGLKKNTNEFIGGAIVVKYLNRVSILASGYNSKYENLYPNYFLYNKIFEMYKDDYDYIDLNGLSTEFNSNSPHYVENQFKLGFNPNIYEFIGEFDIILDESGFKRLQSKDLISKEFQSLKGI